MCGLAITFSKRGPKNGDFCHSLFTKQRSRGQSGFGYIAIREGQIVELARAKTEAEIKPRMAKQKADIFLFHHRLPTSTKNTVGTTHPIFVSNKELKYDYYVAHNGVISNTDWLKSEHEKLGYKYTTQMRMESIFRYADGRTEHHEAEAPVHNDSESLAIELARYLEDKQPRVRTVGGAAFWIVVVHKGTNRVREIIFGKNFGRDLCQASTRKWYYVSSITGKALEEMKLHRMNIDTNEVTIEDIDFDQAKPVSTGFGRSNVAYNQKSLPAPKPSYNPAAWNQAKIDLNRLPENRYYTPREMMEWLGDEDVIHDYFIKEMGNGVVLWKPIKHKDETEEMTPKETEQLEEICEKMAKLENDEELLEENMYNGQMLYQDYEEQAQELEAQKEALQEKIVALGVTDETYEEYMELARQMVDYESTIIT